MTVDWEPFTNRTPVSAEVRLLGRVEIPAILALQKLMVHEVRSQRQVCASVLICEHPPSITVGTDGNLLELPVDRRELDARLLQVHKVKRDGHTILHQPGQLAVYVIVCFDEVDYEEQEFRWRLQEALIRTCIDSHVRVRRDPAEPDVILGRHGLVAETGICVRNRTTSFGGFLNISCALDAARQIGRGLLGQRISSMNAERVRPTIISQARAALICHVCEQIGYPDYHIHTGHPFLRRTRRLVHDKFADH